MNKREDKGGWMKNIWWKKEQRESLNKQKVLCFSTFRQERRGSVDPHRQQPELPTTAARLSILCFINIVCTVFYF